MKGPSPTTGLQDEVPRAGCRGRGPIRSSLGGSACSQRERLKRRDVGLCRLVQEPQDKYRHLEVAVAPRPRCVRALREGGREAQRSPLPGQAPWRLEGQVGVACSHLTLLTWGHWPWARAPRATPGLWLLPHPRRSCGQLTYLIADQSDLPPPSSLLVPRPLLSREGRGGAALCLRVTQAWSQPTPRARCDEPTAREKGPPESHHQLAWGKALE